MAEMHQYEFHSPLSVAGRKWTLLEPGIFELVLNYDENTGRRSSLQRWGPGARNAMNSLHDYFEEVILLEGDLRVVPGESAGSPSAGEVQEDSGFWGTGAYAFRKPGMVHGPFESQRGCLMFLSSTRTESG
ncbi:MAG: hypothetical protein M1820_000274 [Bogoriella megaspora]|nr:MAG: hypothetical protein M1820_000274 [Bogoriella megaspora]